jgi:hypothetical protein
LRNLNPNSPLLGMLIFLGSEDFQKGEGSETLNC